MWAHGHIHEKIKTHIFSKLVPVLTSQALMSWLKTFVAENVKPKYITLDVSQLEISILKESASWNIAYMLVAF